jgi:uracil-DNA glycosylase
MASLGKPPTCRGCPLERIGTGFAGTDGKGTTGVLVVAEALGREEAAAGKPLVGSAGKVWDRLVSRTTNPYTNLRLERDDFLLANCINCQPPDNKLAGESYERAALAHCRPNLERVLEEFKPRAVLALGNTALRWFTGQHGVNQLRGYVFDSPWGPVIPSYHPSYIMRGNWHLSRVVQLDLLRALQVASEGAARLHVEKAYELQPSPQEFLAWVERWRAAGCPPMAFDIETPKADEASLNEEMTFEDDASYQILMCSFAWEPFKAVSVPWIEPYVSEAKKLFAQEADYLVWNAKFDVPRLSAAGVHWGGRIVDVMLAWHWLEPSLPMGLKYVATFFCPDMPAWKLDMHKNFSWYNAADSDVLLRVYQEIVLRLKAEGRWPTFERHFLSFGKILQRMTERGVTVDHAARREARERFQGRFADVVDRAQALAPDGVRTYHPKRGYKKPPKDTRGLHQIEVTLTEAEVLQRQKEAERARQKAAKQAEIQARKNQREAARRAKALGKEAAKRKPRKSRKQKEAS